MRLPATAVPPAPPTPARWRRSVGWSLCLALVATLLTALPAGPVAAQDGIGGTWVLDEPEDVTDYDVDVGGSIDPWVPYPWELLRRRAVQRTAALHDVTDTARVEAHADDEVRASMFQQLLALVVQQQQHADGEPGVAALTMRERTAVEHLREAMHERRIEVATTARSLYRDWHASPCSFRAPHPHEYVNPSCEVSGGLAAYFTHPHDHPPSVDQLKAWGHAAVYPDFYVDGSEARDAWHESMTAFGLLAGVGAAALVSAGFVAAITAGVLTTAALTQLIGSHALVVSYFTGLAGSATLAAAGAVSAFAMAAFAVVVSAFMIADAVEDSKIPGALDDMVAWNRSNVPDLFAEAQTDAGMADLWMVFIDETLGMSHDVPGPDPAGFGDPTFTIVNEWAGSTSSSYVQVVDAKAWGMLQDGVSVEDLPRVSVSVQDGWFVTWPTGRPALRQWDLNIDYLSVSEDPETGELSPRMMTAGIQGNRLIVTPLEPELETIDEDTDVTAEELGVEVTDTIEFVDPTADFTPSTAQLVPGALAVEATWDGQDTPVAINDGGLLRVPEGTAPTFHSLGDDAVDRSWSLEPVQAWEPPVSMSEQDCRNDPPACTSWTQASGATVTTEPYVRGTDRHGPWQVQLTVTGPGDELATIEFTVAARNVAPRLEGAAVDRTTVKSHETLAVTGTVLDPGTDAVVQVDWDTDGNASTERWNTYALEPDGTFEATHAYVAAENVEQQRRIRVRAADGDGPAEDPVWVSHPVTIEGTFFTSVTHRWLDEDETLRVPFSDLWDTDDPTLADAEVQLAALRYTETYDRETGESTVSYEPWPCPETDLPFQRCVEAGAHDEVVLLDDAIEFTPEQDWTGTHEAYVAVCADPDDYDCWQYTSVVMHVAPINDRPVVADLEVAVDEDGQVVVDLADQLSDVETPVEDLQLILGSTWLGTAALDGTTLTYTPDPDATGRETIQYAVWDRGDPDGCHFSPWTRCFPALPTLGSVDVTITPVADPPTLALSAPSTAVAGQDVVIGVRVDDPDAGDAWEFVDGQPSCGHGELVEVSSDGSHDSITCAYSGAAPTGTVSAQVVDASGNTSEVATVDGANAIDIQVPTPSVAIRYAAWLLEELDADNPAARDRDLAVRQLVGHRWPDAPGGALALSQDGHERRAIDHIAEAVGLLDGLDGVDQPRRMLLQALHRLATLLVEQERAALGCEDPAADTCTDAERARLEEYASVLAGVQTVGSDDPLAEADTLTRLAHQLDPPPSEEPSEPDPDPSEGGDGADGPPPGTDGDEGDTGAVTVVAGDTRVHTAVRASRDGFPDGAPVAVLGSAGSFPDALVAAPLARAEGGPVLLTDPGSLSPVVARELARLLAPGATVYLVGGPDALAEPVEAAVQALGFQPVRLAGHDRFATSVEVASHIDDPTRAFLVTGRTFPDALAVGAAAAHVGGAVLLTDDTTVPTVVGEHLATMEAPVVAVGGPAAAAMPMAPAVVGTDRYDTATMVAQRWFDRPSRVSLVSGDRFPDGLAAGAHPAGGPVLLLTDREVPGPVHRWLLEKAGTLTTATVLGGPDAVAPAVVDAVADLLAAPG